MEHIWACRGARPGVWAAGVWVSLKAKMKIKTGEEGFMETNEFLFCPGQESTVFLGTDIMGWIALPE